jgi:hypothetical protein
MQYKIYKKVVKMRNKKIEKFKQSEAIIKKCNHEYEKTIDMNRQNTLQNEPHGKSICRSFLREKCSFQKCSQGINVYTFDTKNKSEGDMQAQLCGNICRGKCHFIDNCVRLKTSGDPYNISTFDKTI